MTNQQRIEAIKELAKTLNFRETDDLSEYLKTEHHRKLRESPLNEVNAILDRESVDGGERG